MFLLYFCLEYTQEKLKIFIGIPFIYLYVLNPKEILKIDNFPSCWLPVQNNADLKVELFLSLEKRIPFKDIKQIG